MTAAERLAQLAGHGGTAAALLLVIGTGATAGVALVDYSQLLTGSAATHLLTDIAVPPAPTFSGGGGGGLTRYTTPMRQALLRDRRERDEELLILLGGGK